MRVAGWLIVLLGLVGALALPVFGLPGAFGVLLITALTLWLVATPTAAACLAPPRKPAGLAALGAGVLSWPLLVVYTFSPLWGSLIAVCGLVVIADQAGWIGARDRRTTGGAGPG